MISPIYHPELAEALLARRATQRSLGKLGMTSFCFFVFLFLASSLHQSGRAAS